MIADTADLVAIGKIVKPFGVKGEMRVRSLSDVPGRFQGLGQVTLVAPSGHTMVTTVSHVRHDRDAYIVGVEAFSTPAEAAVFRGGWIKVPLDQVPPLPADQYYEFQLVGMRVVDESGELLGIIEEILETGSNAVFIVRGENREVLVPGIRDVVASVDVATRTMTIRRVAGLLDDQHAL